MHLIFLGTSSGVPTKNRNLPSIILRRKGEILMFDCGEGTQKQMSILKIGVNRKMKILITHMHGDHILGLPGLIQTMSLFGRTRELEIFGPKGIKGFLRSITKHVPYSLNFKLIVRELASRIIDEKEYEIYCAPVCHSITSFGYIFNEKQKQGRFNPQKAIEKGIPEGPLWKRLQTGENVSIDGKTIYPDSILGPPRKGVKIVYSGDTRPCKLIEEYAIKADILIHDSTYDRNMKNKAEEHMHSTSEEAAKIARRTGIKKLILTHISASYDNEGCKELLNQAKKIFPNTILAEDFMILEL